MNSKKVSLFVGVLGGLIAIGASIGSHIDKNQQELKAELLEKKADSFRRKFEDSILVANRILRSQNDTLFKIAHLQEENRILSRKINHLTDEVLQYETGGENIPIVVIRGYKTNALDPRPDKITFEYIRLEYDIINTSKYPLKDVSIEITDFWSIVYYDKIRLGKGQVDNIPIIPRHDNIPKQTQLIQCGTVGGKSRREQIYQMPIPVPLERLPEHIDVTVYWYGGVIEYALDVHATANSNDTKTEYRQVFVNDKKIKKSSLKELIINEYPLYSRYLR